MRQQDRTSHEVDEGVADPRGSICSGEVLSLVTSDKYAKHPIITPQYADLTNRCQNILDYFVIKFKERSESAEGDIIKAQNYRITKYYANQHKKKIRHLFYLMRKIKHAPEGWEKVDLFNFIEDCKADLILTEMMVESGLKIISDLIKDIIPHIESSRMSFVRSKFKDIATIGATMEEALKLGVEVSEIERKMRHVYNMQPGNWLSIINLSVDMLDVCFKSKIRIGSITQDFEKFDRRKKYESAKELDGKEGLIEKLRLLAPQIKEMRESDHKNEQRLRELIESAQRRLKESQDCSESEQELDKRKMMVEDAQCRLDAWIEATKQMCSLDIGLRKFDEAFFAKQRIMDRAEYVERAELICEERKSCDLASFILNGVSDSSLQTSDRVDYRHGFLGRIDATKVKLSMSVDVLRAIQCAPQSLVVAAISKVFSSLEIQKENSKLTRITFEVGDSKALTTQENSAIRKVENALKANAMVIKVSEGKDSLQKSSANKIFIEFDKPRDLDQIVPLSIMGPQSAEILAALSAISLLR